MPGSSDMSESCNPLALLVLLENSLWKGFSPEKCKIVSYTCSKRVEKKLQLVGKIYHPCVEVGTMLAVMGF